MIKKKEILQRIAVLKAQLGVKTDGTSERRTTVYHSTTATASGSGGDSKKKIRSSRQKKRMILRFKPRLPNTKEETESAMNSLANLAVTKNINSISTENKANRTTTAAVVVVVSVVDAPQAGDVKHESTCAVQAGSFTTSPSPPIIARSGALHTQTASVTNSLKANAASIDSKSTNLLQLPVNNLRVKKASSGIRSTEDDLTAATMEKSDLTLYSKSAESLSSVSDLKKIPIPIPPISPPPALPSMKMSKTSSKNTAIRIFGSAKSIVKKGVFKQAQSRSETL